MQEKSIFSLVVRSVGLIVVVVSAGFLIPGTLSLLMGGPLGGLLFYGVPALLLGLWLLRGAQSIVSFAYPNEPGDELSRPKPN